MILTVLTSRVGLLLVGGSFDSADFGNRSIEERSFGTGEDGFGTGEDGFVMEEGDPESNLVEPFLVVLLTLGVSGAVLPFGATGWLDLLNVRKILHFLTST